MAEETAVRDFDRFRAFNDEKERRRGSHDGPIRRALGNDHVVARLIVQDTIVCVEPAGPAVDEVHFVTVRIAQDVGHGLGAPREVRTDVGAA